jgi:uncharacterized protein YecT (DUF1311 family)
MRELRECLSIVLYMLLATCFVQAQLTQQKLDQADAELNRLYTELRKQLSEADKVELRNRQRQWIANRDQLASSIGDEDRRRHLLTLETQKRAEELAGLLGSVRSRDTGGVVHEDMASHFSQADEELNAVYRELRSVLSEVEQKRLKSVQIEWVKRKEAATSAASASEGMGIQLSMTLQRIAELREQLAGVEEKRSRPDSSSVAAASGAKEILEVCFPDETVTFARLLEPVRLATFLNNNRNILLLGDLGLTVMDARTRGVVGYFPGPERERVAEGLIPLNETQAVYFLKSARYDSTDVFLYDVSKNSVMAKGSFTNGSDAGSRSHIVALAAHDQGVLVYRQGPVNEIVFLDGHLRVVGCLMNQADVQPDGQWQMPLKACGVTEQDDYVMISHDQVAGAASKAALLRYVDPNTGWIRPDVAWYALSAVPATVSGSFVQELSVQPSGVFDPNRFHKILSGQSYSQKAGGGTLLAVGDRHESVFVSRLPQHPFLDLGAANQDASPLKSQDILIRGGRSESTLATYQTAVDLLHGCSVEKNGIVMWSAPQPAIEWDDFESRRIDGDHRPSVSSDSVGASLKNLKAQVVNPMELTAVESFDFDKRSIETEVSRHPNSLIKNDTNIEGPYAIDPSGKFLVHMGNDGNEFSAGYLYDNKSLRQLAQLSVEDVPRGVKCLLWLNTNQLVALTDDGVWTYSVQDGGMEHAGTLLPGIGLLSSVSRGPKPSQLFISAPSMVALVEVDSRGKPTLVYRLTLSGKDVGVLWSDNFYAGRKDVLKDIHITKGSGALPFEQFDLRLNRPDIVLERLGAPAEAVAIAKQLREKRLKRMGVTEEMLRPDFHVPELEIVGDVPSTTDADEISVAIKASDSKYALERLRVYVNNVPVNGRDGESLRDQSAQSLERTIPIKLAAGRNKIQISVLNNAGAESLYANAEVNCTAQRPKPKLYAVALGVSDYANPEWNLQYAAKDARDVLERLKSKSSGSYGEVKELLLTDKQVTKESFGQIKDFLKDATIDDAVLMFVAGHGLLDSNYDYYFGTTDIDFNNPAEKGIAFEEFDDLLAALPCLKKSLLIDTCHAGELDEEEKTLLASAGGTTAPLPTGNGIAMRSIGTRGMNVKAIEGARGASEWYDRLQGLFVDLRRGSGSTILSSSAGAEYALESSEQQNGLFTYAVLEALDGNKEADTNKDGSVQMSELGEYVKKRVAELTNNKQTPNTRRVNLEGDFTLAKTQ